MDVALKIRRLLSALEKVGEWEERGEKGKIEDRLISLIHALMVSILPFLSRIFLMSRIHI